MLSLKRAGTHSSSTWIEGEKPEPTVYGACAKNPSCTEHAQEASDKEFIEY